MGESGNGFTQRKKAFEAKYGYDEELHFRIAARQSHLFGLWAASLLGYKEDKIDTYVENVIAVEVQTVQEQDVLHKVLKDLKEAHVHISEHRIQKKFEKCWEIAHSMLMNDEEL
jgi:hypothetical protein